ncbi:MAG: LCP family protein, partial [Oscillospiraceae bacterium]
IKKKKLTKQQKFNRILATVIIIALSVAGLSWAADKFISSRYNKGEQIPEDIRTADELKDDVVNILVCGLDWEEDRTAMMTDVIMYVTLDVKAKKVSAFQIPRDTYIDDVRGNKINAAYQNGNEKDKIMNTIKLINKRLGLPVDHYVTLDMEAFIAMVDGIDNGLKMYVPYPIILKDKLTGKEEQIVGTPGWCYVDGKTAEQIVRNRNYPNQDLQRLEVQSYFYAAIIKNFTETLNVSDFIKIMNRFTQYLTTDMHWTRIASLAQFGFSVPYENMSIIKPATHGYLSVNPATGKNVAIVVAEEKEWADVLNEHFRPYQKPLSAQELHMEGPNWEVAQDYGYVSGSVQTIADIMNKSPENP